MPMFAEAMKKKMATYAKYPPRKPQSEAYSGPVTLTDYFKFEALREQIKKGVTIPVHTGN
jgi:arylsulfatase